MNDNTAANLFESLNSEQVVEVIAAELDAQAEHGVTDRLRDVLANVGAEDPVDHSDGDSSILEWAIHASDGLVTLTWGITPGPNGATRGFTLHRYNHAESRSWGK